jgi:hypothetical protein
MAGISLTIGAGVLQGERLEEERLEEERLEEERKRGRELGGARWLSTDTRK